MPHSAALLHYLRHLTGPAPTDAELLRRWNEQRDEDAFTALVARHGRIVHGVCRRVIGNRHDADDAFQAVFLILARKAGTLRHPEALAGWLHGVALRVASKARAAASRRLSVESSVPVREEHDPHPDPLDALNARELLALIDREIAALPEAYRLPLLLCDVEEHTQPEATRLLGWTEGSLRGRLLRGRDKLRKRLLRRGIAPETLGAVLAAGLTQTNVDAGVPAALASSVSRSAVLFSNCPTSALIPQSVAALARAGLSGMTLMKLKILTTFALTIGLMAGGLGLAARQHFAPTQTARRRCRRMAGSWPSAFKSLGSPGKSKKGLCRCWRQRPARKYAVSPLEVMVPKTWHSRRTVGVWHGAAMVRERLISARSPRAASGDASLGMAVR